VGKYCKKDIVMKNEIWKDIHGYEGCYQISNLGRVKSLSRMKSTGNLRYESDDIILKPGIVGRGYLHLSLWKNGNKKQAYVHRLVIETFRGKSTLTVNHKNGIKTDNRLENLEYCTYGENNKHAIDNGLRKQHEYKGHFDKKVIQYDLEENYITEHDSITLASKNTNTNRTSIGACCRRELKQAGGFIWKYKREETNGK
jgi:hypothetical protein